MNLTKKIAAAAGALTLVGAGIAAADPPEDAEDDLDPTEAVETEDTETEDTESEDTETTEVEDTETDTTEVEAEDTESEGTGPVDNHGAIVSAVAHMEFETGREHGEAVSTVARTNGGAEDSDAAGATDDAETDDAETDDAETDDASRGASGDHGRP